MTAMAFETMAVFVELSLLQRALDEVFGAQAANVQLRDVSAFTDVALDSLMERLRDELMRPQASALSCRASPRQSLSISLETTP
jgi:hypothetical protein